MPIKRFMVAPFETGMQTNIKPWIIPDDAFSLLKNSYIYRGRVRKRFGSRLMNTSGDENIQQFTSRFRMSIGETNGSGNLTAPADVPGDGAVGQMFSCGDVFFTVYQDGTTLVDSSGGTTATGDYDWGTKKFDLAGSDAALASLAVYFYPALPVMGLPNLETNAINDDQLLGFDTRYSYQYVAGAWTRLATGDSVWSGNNAQFFSGTTYYGAALSDSAFFVVNFKKDDGIRNLQSGTWQKVTYITSGAEELNSGRIILVFKGRLLVLNTIETIAAGETNFGNRVRYSQVGSLVSASDTFSILPGKGGFYDAPTKEVIVSARIVKDRLIVFFERSTWELVYQGNQMDPFEWQKINSELGAESTFASVLFDGDIVGIGNVGIHACNGAYVKRIDDKIPNLIFDIHNGNNGVDRVYGVRDYEAEMIYWAFPAAGKQAADADPVYPNQVLTFNYKTRSWGINDDSITCFGYYQLQEDQTWESVDSAWEGYYEQWNSGDFQSLNRTVIGGNQEGFTFVINKDLDSNAAVLQITNLTQDGSTLRPNLLIIDHNFVVGDFIRVQNCLGNTDLNDTIYEIVQVVDNDNIQVVQPGFDGTPAYSGGGTVRSISKIDMYTKQFNFFVGQGTNVIVPRVDFLVNTSQTGEFTVDIRPSSSRFTVDTFIVETTPYDAYPMEQVQDEVWHPMYPNTQGTSTQLRIYLSDTQMKDWNLVQADLQIGAMLFYARASSSRLQS